MTFGSLHLILFYVTWMIKLNMLHDFVVVYVLILSVIEQEGGIDLIPQCFYVVFSFGANLLDIILIIILWSFFSFLIKIPRRETHLRKTGEIINAEISEWVYDFYLRAQIGETPSPSFRGTAVGSILAFFFVLLRVRIADPTKIITYDSPVDLSINLCI
jgi:hypothetical protein